MYYLFNFFGKSSNPSFSADIKVVSPSVDEGFAKISIIPSLNLIEEGIPRYPNGPHLSAIDPGFVRFRTRPVTPEILSAQLRITRKLEQIQMSHRK